jgi:FkbM family methyltransferase
VIDLSAIDSRTLVGRALRAPLRLLPTDLVVPVLQGPLRGTRWIVGSATHGCWVGSYEATKQRACLRHLRPGLTAYDVGANVGFYTLLFSRLVGDPGAVHAFEPLPRNVEYLERHVALNGAANVRIHPVAVGRSRGTAAFEPARHASMGRLVTSPSASTRPVPVVCLDDVVYADGQPPPDLVKMDVEGGEADVLAGMRRLLAEKRPTLLVALHGTDQWTRCRGLFDEAGYGIRDLAGEVVDPASEPDEIVARPAGS